MGTSPILGITQVATNQNNKEVTINNAVSALESATQSYLPVSLTSGNVTLSPTQFSSAVCFALVGQTATATLTVPATTRLFVVQNQGTYAVTVTTGATGTPTNTTVAAGSTAVIYVDTRNCLSLAGGASSNAMTYAGSWNANSNSPSLMSGTGLRGSVYSVSVAGSTALDGISQWNVGDKAIFNGTAWEKIDGISNEVLSVVGMTGAIAFSDLVTAGLAPIASPVFTGAPTLAAAPATSDSSLKLTTTGWVTGYVTSFGYAPLVSPALSGVPTTSTPATPDNSGRIANTAWAVAYVSSLALAPLASPAFTGSPTATTQATSDNSTKLATTAWGVGYVTSLALAPLASPALTGTPTVPTPTTGDNSTKATNTAWVRTYVTSLGYSTTASAEQVANKGVANGYAPLDGSSKVPLANLPAAVAGALSYQGTWNATTNTPALASGTGAKGYFYTVATAGTTSLDGYNSWSVGDKAVFNGSTWEKIDGVANEVLGVAGLTGNITVAQLVAAGLAPTASPTFTGTVAVPTPTAGDNSTKPASTAFVVAGYAPLASPTFTGTVTIPTPTVGDNSTKAASTAFVLGQGFEVTANKGVANGYAPLDSSSKVPLANLPAAIAGALSYQGTWNASTNSPTLSSGAGTKGYFYTVSTSGTTSLDGYNSWSVGDKAVFNGSTWEKIDGVANEVLGVAGLTGNITLAQLVSAGLAPLASPSFTGTVTVPTPTAGDNSTKAATTAWTMSYVSGSYAPLASPAFTGTPTTPTPGTSDNSTTATNTAWVRTYVTSLGYSTSAASEQVANKGAANGYAPLDSNSRVPLANLPAALSEAIYFAGTWNASTNSPSLTSGSGSAGAMYKVTTAGSTSLDGISQWNVGDEAVFSGVSNTWQKLDGLASEVLSVAGRTGAVTIGVSDVSGAAPLASPALTGTPTSTTPSTSDNSTNIATTAWGVAYVTSLSLATLASPAFTGSPTAPTPTTSDNSTKVATTAWGVSYVTSLALAPLASPALTGTPTAPTPVINDSSTKIATTAMVQQVAGGVTSVSVAGSSNVTLTAAQAANAIISLTGALTGNITVSVPSVSTRSWVVSNQSSGAFTITFSTTASGGTTQPLIQGQNVEVWSDGTNIYLSTSYTPYSQLPTEVQTVPLPFVFVGKPTASGLINIVMGQKTTINANFGGTVAYFSTAPGATATWTVNKIVSGTLTSVGTIALTSGSHSTLTLSSQATFTLNAGDVLQLVAPSTQDANLADGCITIMGLKV